MSERNITFTQEQPHRNGRLLPKISFYLLVSVLVSYLTSSSAPTPLYALYAVKWGFSPITETVIFGVYAVAVLFSLLTVGSLSDYVGRRPVLIGALAIQAVAMLVFATAGGIDALIIARVLQGLATGAAVSALGAALLDFDKVKGTIANAVGSPIGMGLGSIMSGVMVQFLPAPTHLIYFILLVVFIVQGLGVLLIPESADPKAGALSSLVPHFGIPATTRKPLVAAVPALVATWALMAFYGSIGPTVVKLITHSNSYFFAGLPLFAIAGSASITILIVRSFPSKVAMLLGMVALIVGVGCTLLATVNTSILMFFIGTVVAGVGFGGGFQGAFRIVLPLAKLHERAGLLSTLYVICYIALGVPAVIAGIFVEKFGILNMTREYGLVVMIFGALSALGLGFVKKSE